MDDILQLNENGLHAYSFLNTSSCNYTISISNGHVFIKNSIHIFSYNTQNGIEMGLFKTIVTKENSIDKIIYFI